MPEPLNEASIDPPGQSDFCKPRRALVREIHQLRSEKSRMAYHIIRLLDRLEILSNPDMSAVKTDKEHFTKGLQ